MSGASFSIQSNPTENLISCTSDCDVLTPHRYASPLVDSSPPDKTTETGEPGVHQGGDQIYSPRPLDAFATQSISAFGNFYPHGASHELFERPEGSPLGNTEQYHLSSSLEASDFDYPDALLCSLPALGAASPSMHAPQDVMHWLLSTQVHRDPSFPPQGTPSFHLASNTGPRLESAPSTTMHMGGAAGHNGDPYMSHHNHFSPPVADPGYGSNVMFDTPASHSNLDPVVQGMRSLSLNSEASISPDPKIASQQPSVTSPLTGYADPLYASPKIAEADGQDHPSSATASGHAGKDLPTQNYHPQENETRSCGEQMSTWTHGEVASGHGYRSTAPPHSNTAYQSSGGTIAPPHYDSSRTMMFDQMPDPGFSPQAYFPAYPHYDPAAPVTIHAAGEGNSTAGSLASFDDRYSYSLQQPAPWDDRMRHSTATTTTRAQRVTPSWQYRHRALSPSTTTVYPNDVAANTLPRNVGPVPHRNPRQRSASFISPYPELGARSTSGDGHFVASSSVLSDEDRTDCSPPPATCPPATRLNAQSLLRRVLGHRPRLQNEALIKLILLILHAPFYRMHEMEPTGDSEDGMALLRQLESTPGYTPATFDTSIYTLFVSRSKFRCLICESFKQSMVRAIGCVRSHLKHRPFPCLGCRSCPKGQIVKRFFTASLLHDHCSKQERTVDCIYCGETFTGNIKRHWETKHKDTPFPYEKYPNHIPE